MFGLLPLKLVTIRSKRGTIGAKRPKQGKERNPGPTPGTGTKFCQQNIATLELTVAKIFEWETVAVMYSYTCNMPLDLLQPMFDPVSRD